MDNFSALPGVFKLSNSLLMLLGVWKYSDSYNSFSLKWWR